MRDKPTKRPAKRHPNYASALHAPPSPGLLGDHVGKFFLEERLPFGYAPDAARLPKIRAATGKPAHRFVLERRVERARWRLLQGDASVTDVALETGPAHASHLARRTRRLLGVSPSDVLASAR